VKRCSRCHEWKTLDQFPRNRRAKDGYHCYCKSCHNQIGREYKQRRYGGARHYHLRHRYGITAAQVDRMIAEQGGVCALCKAAEPKHVDHDHATGRVRGILCFGCNGGLGQFGDNIDRLVLAIAYLDRDDELSALARERLVALSA
jgi:hypothetical protein